MSNPLEIDKHQLDVEWAKQANTMRVFTKKLAKAKKAVRDLKQSLKVNNADLSLKIRKLPGKFGIEKVTEASVDSAIVLHERTQSLEQELSDAMYEMELLDGITTSLDQKKTALHDLVHLYTIGYFADMKPTAEQDEFLASRKPAGVKQRNRKEKATRPD